MGWRHIAFGAGHVDVCPPTSLYLLNQLMNLDQTGKDKWLGGERGDHLVKHVLKGHSQKDQNLVFKTNFLLMQVKSITECFNLHIYIVGRHERDG